MAEEANVFDDLFAEPAAPANVFDDLFVQPAAKPAKPQGMLDRLLLNPLGRGKNQILDQSWNMFRYLKGETTAEEYAAEVMRDQREAASYPHDPRDVATLQAIQKGTADTRERAAKQYDKAAAEADDPLMKTMLEGMAKGARDPSVGGITSDMLSEAAANPAAIVGIGVESAPVLAPIIGGAVVGGAVGTQAGPVGTVAGAAIGGGTASGMIEFMTSMQGFFHDRKMDLNEKTLAAAIQDPKLLSEARAYAAKRGLAVGVFDALSIALAGRVGPATRNVVGGPGTVLREGVQGPLKPAGFGARVAGGVAEVGTQATLGGGGEAAAQLATEGKISRPADVFFEAAAEGPMSILEIPSYMAATGARPTAAPPSPDEALPAGTIIPDEEVPPPPPPPVTPPTPAETAVKSALPEQAAKAAELPDSPRLTPADRKSPIPNELIDEGKAAVEAATGQPSTFTTTTEVDGKRTVVTGNVADLVAQDKAETAALISQITAGVPAPQITQPAPQAAPPAAAAGVSATLTPPTAGAAPAPAEAEPQFQLGGARAGHSLQAWDEALGTVYQLPPTDKATLATAIEDAVEVNGEVTYNNLPREITNKIGTGELRTLKGLLASNPSLLVDVLRGDRSRLSRAIAAVPEEAAGPTNIAPVPVSEREPVFQVVPKEPAAQAALKAKILAKREAAAQPPAASPAPAAGVSGAISPTQAAAAPTPAVAPGKVEARLKGGQTAVIDQYDEETFRAVVDGKRVAEMHIATKGGAPYVRSVTSRLQRQGIAQAMYDAAEKMLGRRLIPSPSQITEDGLAFWKNRLSKMAPEEKQAVLAELVRVGDDVSRANADKLGYREPAVAPAAPRAAGETDKEFAKRVVDKRPAPKALPEKYDDYFIMDEPGTVVVPIGDLVSSKTDEENRQGGGNAVKRMEAAAKGELAKRGPITVKRIANGKYLITDGNGTYTSVKDYGWKAMPVVVEGADHPRETSQVEGEGHLTSFTGEAATPEQREIFRRHTFATVDALYEDAQARQDELAAVGKDIAGRNEGIKFKNPGLKDKAESVLKIPRKKYEDARQLTDAIRIGFDVSQPGMGSEIVRALARHFEVLDEGWNTTEQGYFDRKVLVRFDDGRIGEVQIWEPHVLAAKEDPNAFPHITGGVKGSVIYNKWRKDPHSAEGKVLEKQMLDLYAHALSLADASAWARVISEGKLSRPEPKYLNLRRQTSSSSRPQVDQTSGKSTLTQSVEPGLSSALASKSEKTTGRSSQLQNFTGAPPSNENVLRNAPPVKPEPAAQKALKEKIEAKRKAAEEAAAEEPKFMVRTPEQGAIGATPTGGKKGETMTVKDIALGFHEEHMAKEGRQLFPEKDAADYDHVVNDMASPELTNQMQQERSGEGWYHEDTANALDITSQLFPTLATNQEHRDLFLIYAGIFGNGPDPVTAWVAAGEAFDLFIRTGEIPVKRGEASAKAGLPVKMSVGKDKKTGGRFEAPTGWTQRNAANEQQIGMFKRLVEQKGSIAAAMRWLTRPQPRAEINQVMTDAGYEGGRYVTKEALAGPNEYGALIFGPKLGRYILGLNGIELTSEDATVDKWFVRTYRRWTGRLFEGPIDDSGIAGQPNPREKDIERRTIFRMVGDLAKAYSLKPGDVQAVLWFHEQRLYDASGVPTEAGTNTDGAIKLLEQRGVERVRQDVDTRSDAAGDRAGRKDEPRFQAAGRAKEEVAAGRSFAFISPNVAENTLIEDAVRGLGSDRQRALLSASREIDDAFNVKEESQDAIGAWSDGAENTTVAAGNVDWETLRVISAMKGHLADQKAVLIFKQNDGGASALYRMRVPETDVRKLNENLVADGVVFHTLVPHKSGTDVFVVDLDGSAHDAVAKAAERYDVDVDTQRGQADFIGTTQETGTAREQRDDARRAYEEVIRQSPVQGSQEHWSLIRDNWGKALKERPSRQPAGAFRISETSRGGIRTTFELTPEFVARARAVLKTLRAELNRLGLKDVPLRVGETIEAIVKGETIDAGGRFFKGIIDVALSSADTLETLHHEAVHALRRMGLFGEKTEWPILERLSKTKWMDQYRIGINYAGFSEEAQIEEGVVAAYVAWRKGQKFDSVVVKSFKKIQAFIEAFGNALRGNGFNSADSIFRSIERGEVGARPRQQKAAPKASEKADPAKIEALFQTTSPKTPPTGPDDPRFNLQAPPRSSQQAQQTMQGFIQRGQPIDRAMRFVFDLFGGLDGQGRWRAPKRLNERLQGRGVTGRVVAAYENLRQQPQRREGASIGALAGATIGGLFGPVGLYAGIFAGGTAGAFILGSPPAPVNGQFKWLANITENAKRGLISNYGLDPEYVEAYRNSDLGRTQRLRQAAGIMKVLHGAGVGTAEAEVLQAILSGKPVADAAMTRLAMPIRQAIDAMGAEAVSEGLISAESFERNRGAYLHRVYTKHELDPDTNKLAGWISRQMTSRRKKIIGDSMKGRGIFWEVPVDRLMKDAPNRPIPGKGDKWRVLDRTSADGKVSRRVYVPADKPVPVEFTMPGWVDRGEWEVRQVRGVTPTASAKKAGPQEASEVTLWRDYTEEERGQMGEILDARYTITKTFMLAANDITTGKFFREVSEKAEWTRDDEPPAHQWKEGGEYNVSNGRYWTDREIQWVKVPDTNIGKTGGKKKWGKLAGKFVRAEIWRDLNEIELAQNPGTWRKIFRQWKMNHTSRHPVVHMNNIMSNVMFMDLADIRTQDLIGGLNAYVRETKDFQEAVDNGAFGSDIVAQELRDKVLKPILAEITKTQQTRLLDPLLTKLGVAGIVADKLWTSLKWADEKMMQAYQMEDEIFRMAAYMRRRSQGATPAEAAQEARDQFLNYDIRAPWVVAMRNTALPFISYTYRAMPKLMEAIMNRPWKVLKYGALAAGVNALSYMLDDWDDDEEDKKRKDGETRERASLRDEEQGYTWLLTPRMVRMPWRDGNGLPVFFDVRRWIPAGDVFDNRPGQTALPIPAPLQFGGPLMLAAEFMLNKMAFSGQEITNELTDDEVDRVTNVADWAWKAWAPPAFWTPRSHYWTKLWDAAYGATDRAGTPYSLPQAMLSSIGIKIKGVDVENGILWHFKHFKRVEGELKSQLRDNSRRLYQGLISQRAHDSEASDIYRKMDRTIEKIEEFAKTIKKPKRERVP